MANQIVAYQDERHGLGAWVAEQVAAHMFRYGNWVDADGNTLTDEDDNALRKDPPRDAVNQTATAYGMSLSTSRSYAPGMAQVMERPKANPSDELSFAYKTWTTPRTTADATFSTVISGQAQVGVVPLFDGDGQFVHDTLAALIAFPQRKLLREYVAESNYVLAAPTDLIHEIEQSGYTDSFSSSGSSASFQWNREKQQRYLRKVTQVFASADAMKHCTAAIDGLRAKGVDIQLLPDGVDTYREGLRIATQYLDPNRKVETHFSGKEHKRVSRTEAGNHNKPVIAVLLSHDKALNVEGGYNFDSDYAVLDAEMAGAQRIRTSFVAMAASKPDLPPSSANPVDFDMSGIRRHFSTEQPGEGIPSYVRYIYKFDTTGKGVGDYSSVLRELTEAGLSFRTTSLDSQPGSPMIVAVDVPAPRWKDMKPIIRAVYKQRNARRLADFPAVQPMVPEAIRPAPATTGRVRTAIGLIGAVGAALLAFVLWKM